MLTIDQIKQSVVKYARKYGIKNAYLFGSYAKGAANDESDVDIIIDKGNLQTYKEYSNFLYGLEDDLGAKVDLLTTEGVKPRFFELIKNDRMLLYGA